MYINFILPPFFSTSIRAGPPLMERWRCKCWGRKSPHKQGETPENTMMTSSYGVDDITHLHNVCMWTTTDE